MEKHLDQAHLWLPSLIKRKLFIASLVAVVGCAACTRSSQDELNLAISEVEGGRVKSAIQYFDRALAKANSPAVGIEVAREAARASLFDIKDYKKALGYFQFVVVNSEDPKERLEAQKQIVEILFSHLVEYQNAIPEIYKLTQMMTEQSDRVEYRIKLAKAYFYTNDFFQAESEVDEHLRQKLTEDQKFDLLLLKSNIASGRKETDRATEILSKIIQDFPERAKKENLGLTLAVAYEDSGQFEKAISELTKLKDQSTQPEIVELRIKRLNERKVNQPGRRGRKK